jgi:hypothetical protein
MMLAAARLRPAPSAFGGKSMLSRNPNAAASSKARWLALGLGPSAGEPMLDGSSLGP